MWGWQCFLDKDIRAFFGVKQFITLWTLTTSSLSAVPKEVSQHRDGTWCRNTKCIANIYSKKAFPPPHPDKYFFFKCSFIRNSPPLQEHYMADSEGHIPCILAAIPNSLFMCGFGWSSEDLLKHSYQFNPKLHSFVGPLFLWQPWHPRSF